MNTAEFSTLLVEETWRDALGEPEKIFVDRLLMRLYSAPALLAALNDVNVLPDKKPPVVQLDFVRIPNDIISDISRIIGVPATIKRFNKGMTDHFGVEVELKPELFTNFKLS